ncbi:hypothetical protein Ctha_0067 [Chloroherpeton thalassium ATCC 35110]|uniref:Uncharacterized protein n=1 Tax=Chloroherpeton thalassium (strain ATCC 35110 / GB-78) TaxID=517418 RepID=B3QSE7_CHLT3|nr:hypothetical protein [Chloroherpeton thalassium]ACF12538.1 hypothetical protein Ctha_0067 [Chloroherpeton thalassium ATCC 35110]
MKCLLFTACRLIFCASLLFGQNPEKSLQLLEKANLVTIPALNNTSEDAKAVLRLPSTLFLTLSQIASEGSMTSKSALENSLFNTFESNMIFLKGVFRGKNALQAGGFELMINRDGRSGKTLIYEDTLFAKPRFFLRWRHTGSATEYLLRKFIQRKRLEETALLHSDGSGSYERKRCSRILEKFRWNKSGELEKSE